MWLAIALAVSAIGFSAWRWAYQSGRDSRQPEVDRINLALLTLRASVETANAQATQKAQEAAQMARAIEDEQRRRIEEVEAMVASYNALADLDRSNYDKRLRNALAARACRGDAPDPGRMPEAASSEPRPAETAGLVSDPLSGNLGEFISGDVEGLNKQFHICYAAAYSGREISR